MKPIFIISFSLFAFSGIGLYVANRENARAQNIESTHALKQSTTEKPKQDGIGIDNVVKDRRVPSPKNSVKKDITNETTTNVRLYTENAFTDKPVSISKDKAKLRLKYILDGNVYKAFESEIGRKTKLERKVFLESSEGQSYAKLLARERKNYLSFAHVFTIRTYNKIHDYDVESNSFLIDLEDKYSYKKIPGEKDYIKSVHSIIFRTMPIFHRNEFGKYNYSSFKIKVSEKNALLIEQNRRNIKIELFFFLSKELEEGKYSVLDATLSYKMPVAKAALFRLSLDGKILFQKIYQ